MHEIQIDDEVMARLKQEAEPFVDSPNDVLRRLLVERAARPEGRGRHEYVPATVSEVLATPFGVPKALEQILAVARRVRFMGESRVDATHAVAEGSGVAFQTVLDKYTRQLGLEAAQFDEMLSSANTARLSKLLCERFPDQSRLITQMLSEENQMMEKEMLDGWVVDSLRSRGGEAHHVQIAKDVWSKHEEELRGAGDLFYTWQYDLRWAGHRLRDAGVLLPDSATRKGHWKLRST